jgi:hypothetical protein
MKQMQKSHPRVAFFTFVFLAERRGFEPRIGYEPIHAFQACDLNHSSISPDGFRADVRPREAAYYIKDSRQYKGGKRHEIMDTQLGPRPAPGRQPVCVFASPPHAFFTTILLLVICQDAFFPTHLHSQPNVKRKPLLTVIFAVAAAGAASGTWLVAHKSSGAASASRTPSQPLAAAAPIAAGMNGMLVAYRKVIALTADEASLTPAERSAASEADKAKGAYRTYLELAPNSASAGYVRQQIESL